jgi:hypothetical protein
MGINVYAQAVLTSKALKPQEDGMQSQSTVGDQKRGLFRELHGIAVAMEPADLSVYRSVLPAVLSVPDLPIVSAWIASWDDVQGLRPYREGAVRLRCAYEGKEGWFVTTMPVTSVRANISGRMLAFPKYTADEITLNTSPESPRGEVRHSGLRQLMIQLGPGPTRELTPQEQTVLEQGQAVWDAPYYFLGTPSRWTNWLWRMWQGLRDDQRMLVRAGEKAVLLRITATEAVPSTMETSQPRIAHTAVNPAAPWAGLFPEDGEVLGAMFRWIGGVALAVQELS